MYWKTGSIIPLLKDGDNQCIGNYRLITLLNSISKVLETLIFDKLYKALYKVIALQQHGFIYNSKYNSTIKQMILYLSELFKKLDLTTLATLYLDVEKAFDKVCHEKLIEKLRAMGIAGGALTLLESYLTERYQKLKIVSTESTALQVLSGVPQGSVLGALFFNQSVY